MHNSIQPMTPSTATKFIFRRIFPFVLPLALPLNLLAQAPGRIKILKLAITNPMSAPRPRADIAVPLALLRRAAPDFTPGSEIVLATQTASVTADNAVLHAHELASQVDALHNPLRPDTLALQLNLGPHQTRIVSIAYGDAAAIWRLRRPYRPRTDALFTRKIQGLGWESRRMAFRLYFDSRNAIDLYGKRQPGLLLRRLFAVPGYVYHQHSPLGRDIFLVGKSLGVGGVAALAHGRMVKVARVRRRSWRIISTGPVRAIVDATYAGWLVNGERVRLRSRFTIWAGESGFEHQVRLTAAHPVTLVTGITRHRQAPLIRPRRQASRVHWLASWGRQVVSPGPRAVMPEMAHEKLGLAIISATRLRPIAGNAANHLLQLRLRRGRAQWYALAAWSGAESHRMRGWGNARERGALSSIMLPPHAVTTRAAFLAAVRAKAARLAHPVIIRIAAAGAPESAPPDTLDPTQRKTPAQALTLLLDETRREARACAPIVRQTPSAAMTKNHGAGFFTNGNNQTGLWQPQKGFFWTGGFWVGQLWQAYALTHQPRYRRWAELWNARLLGKELTEDHDTGFLNYYSSALGYGITHQARYRAGALRAARRLRQLYNPVTHLIAAWRPRGEDSIIDTMMNLQNLWWASCQTGDPQWRQIGQSHARRAARWFIRPNGSVFQSVHYNPGDNPQFFNLGRGPRVLIPNHVPPGHWVFKHTHQGWGADTSWARGTAWAVYGFAEAYKYTHQARFLATANRVAHFALTHLPADHVPWYDFDDPGVHYRNRDSSAAAILADGLLRLSNLETRPARARQFRAAGRAITQSLIDRYLTPVFRGDPTPPGILRHGSGMRPQDTPLVYGQYYLMDALLWLRRHNPRTGRRLQPSPWGRCGP